FQVMPLLTRRGIFFSATVDPEFPQSVDGRRLLHSYRLQAALWTVLAIGLAWLLAPAHPEYGATLPVWLMVAGIGFSYWLKFREVHDIYGSRHPEVRETSLSPDTDEDGIHFWVVLPPFLAIAATALYLHAHWNQIPAQFPMHWGINGLPNRWASRDVIGVYGALLMAAVFNLLLLVFAWALMRMSRKGVMLHVTVRMLEVLLYPLTFAFVAASLLPLARFPLWLAPAVLLGFTAGILVWAYQKITAPALGGETPEPQNDSYWRAGIFYYNPGDPAIFVQKRVGIGYTMNFANKISWLVLAGILFIALLPALLRGSK
ncbi:MAG TPA: DUF5808 domain-containing protein, partial [Terriglobales bacterium]